MISFPRGIYLEASVLCSLGPQIINAQMERLKGLCSAIPAPILIPELSLQEWIRKRKREVDGWIDEVETGLSNLARIFDYASKPDWEKDKESMSGGTDASTRKVLKDFGIFIIPTPQISVKKLVYMSINNIRPFEERKEKGFRDSVTLLTVLKYAQKQKDGFHLLVATDEIYQHEDVQALAEEYGVNLKVSRSIPAAISTLEKLMRRVEKVFDDYRKLTLGQFLLNSAHSISEHMKEKARFAPSFLLENYKPWPWTAPEIMDIKDIKVVGVDSVMRGVLPKGKNTGKVAISFEAKTIFAVRIREYVHAPEPRLKYGKPSPVSPGASLATILGNQEEHPFGRRITKNVHLEQNIPIEGSVFFRTKKKRGQDRGRRVLGSPYREYHHMMNRSMQVDRQ